MAASATDVARLAAGAKGGTAGVDAFDQAQQGINSSRDAAVSNLQSVAGKAGAPGALTAQLTQQLMQPAAVADANLGALGGAADYGEQQTAAGTANYRNEASQALPLITAESNRAYQLQANDETRSATERLTALKLAQAKTAGGVTDSQLKTRLMGQAITNRQQALAALSQKYTDALAQVKAASPDNVPVPNAPHGFRGQADPTNYAARVNTFGNQYQDQAGLYQKALDNIKVEQAQLSTQANALQGPGITGEAQKIGVAAGYDPARVAGLLTPQDDASYVAAQTKLGLYQDPNKDLVTGTLLDPQAAATQLKLSPAQLQTASSMQHLNWGDASSPNPTTTNAFNAWAIRADPAGTKYGNGVTTNPNSGAVAINYSDAGLAQARNDFAASPTGKALQTSVATDTLKAGMKAAASGWSITAWVNQLDPNLYKQYQPAFDLAFAQLKPVFDYYQAVRTKTAQPDTNSALPAAAPPDATTPY